MVPDAKGPMMTAPPFGGGHSALSRDQTVLRELVWGFTFFFGGWLGSLTTIGSDERLFWPPAAVSIVWFASGNRRTWAWDALGLALATVATQVLISSGWHVTVAVVVGNLVQVAAFLAVVHRWGPDLWGFGGDRILSRVRDVAVLVLGTALSTLAAAGVGALLLHTLWGSGDLEYLVMWWSRNAAAILILGGLGLLCAPAMLAVRRPGDLWDLLRARISPGHRAHAAEAVALLLVTAALYALNFFYLQEAPSTFLMLATAAWVGIRFSSVSVVLYSLLLGTTTVVFTVLDLGPFASMTNPSARAVMVQLFMSVWVLTGLTLSFARSERDALIAEMAASEAASQARARELELILASLTEGLAVVEEGGRFVMQNPAVGRLLGLPGDPDSEVRPVHEYQLFHPDGKPLLHHEIPYERALRGEVVAGEYLHLRHPDIPGGRVLEVGARLLPTLNHRDRPRAVTTVRDVTAEHANRDALVQFAGVVAHDLSSPLTVIDGWAETLVSAFEETDTVSRDVGIPMLNHVTAASAHMRNFIRDLLAYSVARDQTLKVSAVDLNVLVSDVVDLLIESSGDPIPIVQVARMPVLWSDPLLTRQLLDNLIGNGVKYVPEGTRPWLTVSAREERPGWARISVCDNGIGIEEKDKAVVFETFHRVRSGGYRGTGLGLSICKRIVERHGGQIRATDNPSGVGTCFTFTMPTSAEAYAGAVETDAGAAR